MKIVINIYQPLIRDIFNDVFMHLIPNAKIFKVEKINQFDEIDLLISDNNTYESSKKDILNDIQVNKELFLSEGIIPNKFIGNSILSIEKFSSLKEHIMYLRRSLLEEAEFLSDQSSSLIVSKSREPLTLKQVAVLEYLCEGHSEKSIAKELNLSKETVRSRIKDAYIRLEATNKTQAIIKYTQIKNLAILVHGEEEVFKNLTKGS